LDEQGTEPRPVALTPEQQEKLESLAREAAIARRRGDRDNLTKVMEQAKELAPDSPQVMEFIGDELMERKKYAEAADIYRKAHELAPDNKSLESKHADAAYAKAMGSLPMDLKSDFDNVANARVAAILSAICPGLGQIVSGEVGTGVAMLVGWVVSWGITLAIPNGLKGLLSVVGIGRANVNFNPLVLLTLFVAAGIHLWAYADAASKVKVAQPKKMVDHPVPPVDKDYI